MMSIEKNVKSEKVACKEQSTWNHFEKYAYTLLLLLIHMCYALSYATFGPAFVDFKYILNSSMQWISIFSTLLSAGNILGTLFGLSFKYLNRQLTIIILLVVMSITSTSVAFTLQLWQFYVCALLYGLGAGAWTTANNVWLIEIWQKDSQQVLFLSQLMYGVGAIIGPLIDSPYLTGEMDIKWPHNQTNDLFHDNYHTNDSYLISPEQRRNKLKTPFIISGAIQITLPILMSIMFLIRRYKPIEELKTSDDKNLKLFDRSGKPRLLLIALMAISLSTINSLELVFFNFGSTYLQFTAVPLTASTAASVMSVLSAAYTAGQAINFFIVMCVPTKYMIGYHFLITFGSIISLYFIQSETGFWVLSAVIGFGFSVLFPGIFAHLSKYIDINNRIGTFIYLTSGIVNFVPPLILGSYIENNPLVFILIELIYLSICFTTYLFILILIRKHK